MMITTILSTIDPSVALAVAESSALLGYGLLASLILIIALSSQRWLLWYVLGGVVYWLSVELIYNGLTSFTILSEWHSYVAAIAISWLPLFGWILYRALRYEDVSHDLQKKREVKLARYIEHTPIYDDDYTPRFE